MKILISSFGTRGDVQPYLALAVGLQQAGHQVTLATSYNYTGWIQTYPTRFSMQEFMRQPEIQAVLTSRNVVQKFRVFRQMMSLGAEAMDEVWAAIENADFVIQSPTSSGALEAAQIHGLPVALACPVPFAPTHAFPSFFLGPVRFSLGASYNYLTHRLMHQLLWVGMGGPMTNKLRKRLGLRPWHSYAAMLNDARRLGIPMLYGFSPNVIAKPADWDEQQHITGYWFLDPPPDWQPPVDLVHFLEGGSLPVYIGFGSMGHEDAERQTHLALKALELAGQRGVLVTGWGGITRLSAPANVYFADDLPHSWLFPRMAAVVHHGGAGTTAAGLRAGIPNIIIPVAAPDQYAWAERVVQLEVGSGMPNIKKLTAEKLAVAIHTSLTDRTMQARTQELGEKIRAENGMTQAVNLIERQALVKTGDFAV